MTCVFLIFPTCISPQSEMHFQFCWNCEFIIFSILYSPPRPSPNDRIGIIACSDRGQWKRTSTPSSALFYYCSTYTVQKECWELLRSSDLLWAFILLSFFLFLDFKKYQFKSYARLVYKYLCSNSVHIQTNVTLNYISCNLMKCNVMYLHVM